MTDGARVLIVEDDESLSSLVAFTLDAAGMQVTEVRDGSRALEVAAREDFDAIVLDLMLPAVDGFEVCRELRQRSRVPIVILTARTATGDLVRALELGADDYITKPFEAPELLARLRAVLRRAEPDAEPTLVGHGLRLDVAAHVARLGDEVVDLSATEFRLLTELMRHAGQVMTRDVLLRRVWDYDYLGDSRLVDMAVKRLRDKVEDDSGNPERITTVRGVGYRFEAA